jgi:hypothetical protein
MSFALLQSVSDQYERSTRHTRVLPDACMIPKAFYTQSILRNLNIAAVGLALAALTAAIASFATDGAALVCGLPTLFVGMLWAALLRWRKTVGSNGFRAAWLLSAPLAATNAGLACAATFLETSLLTPQNIFEQVGGGLFIGATFGALIWIPALVLTLFLFGSPIARSQRLAALGVVGEEQGEALIGKRCAWIGGIAILVTMWSSSMRAPMPLSFLFPIFSAITGLVAGVAATRLASLRQRDRRAFVGEVAAGNIPGYRVEDTAEGKALVRVVSMGQGYRVADFSQEILRLDALGNVQAALELANDLEASAPTALPMRARTGGDPGHL